MLKARVLLRRALKRGRLTEIDAAREAFRTAQDGLLAVVSRVQRTARLAADVRYGQAATLEFMRCQPAANVIPLLHHQAGRK